MHHEGLNSAFLHQLIITCADKHAARSFCFNQFEFGNELASIFGGLL